MDLTLFCIFIFLSLLNIFKKKHVNIGVKKGIGVMGKSIGDKSFYRGLGLKSHALAVPKCLRHSSV